MATERQIKKNEKLTTEAVEALGAVLRATYGGRTSVRRIMGRVGIAVQRAVRYEIKNSPRGGRVYKRKRKTHKASAPGQAPAVDSGALLRSYTYQVGDGYVDVGSNIEYAPYLEFGTRKMAPRPHLRPAVQRITNELAGTIANELTGTLRDEVRKQGGKA